MLAPLPRAGPVPVIPREPRCMASPRCLLREAGVQAAVSDSLEEKKVLTWWRVWVTRDGQDRVGSPWPLHHVQPGLSCSRLSLPSSLCLSVSVLASSCPQIPPHLSATTSVCMAWGSNPEIRLSENGTARHSRPQGRPPGTVPHSYKTFPASRSLHSLRPVSVSGTAGQQHHGGGTPISLLSRSLRSLLHSAAKAIHLTWTSHQVTFRLSYFRGSQSLCKSKLHSVTWGSDPRSPAAFGL